MVVTAHYHQYLMQKIFSSVNNVSSDRDPCERVRHSEHATTIILLHRNTFQQKYRLSEKHTRIVLAEVVCAIHVYPTFYLTDRLRC